MERACQYLGNLIKSRALPYTNLAKNILLRENLKVCRRKFRQLDGQLGPPPLSRSLIEHQYGTLTLRGPRAQYQLTSRERNNISAMLAPILKRSKRAVLEQLPVYVTAWAKLFADQGRVKMEAIFYQSGNAPKRPNPRSRNASYIVVSLLICLLARTTHVNCTSLTKV